MKGLLCLALCCAMVLENVPGLVFAEEAETETEAVIEETETEAPVTVMETLVTAEEENWPSNEELFAVYAEGVLYGNRPAVFGTSAYDRLTEEDINVKLAYEALKPELEKIARGERESTSIKLGYAFTNVHLTDGTVRDFPVDIAVDFQGTEFDIDLLLHTVLADMPYEMYWSTKSLGLGYANIGGKLNLTVSFEVAGNYAPNGATGGYTVDKNKTGAASIVRRKGG